MNLTDTIRFPFHPDQHPACHDIRAFCREWADRHGLNAEGIWDDAYIVRCDFGLYGARLFPYALPERVYFGALWGMWAFYVDDVCVRRLASARDEAVDDIHRLDEFLHRPEQPRDAVERGLQDILAMGRRWMSPVWNARFLHHMRETFFEGILWELSTRTVPDFAEQLTYRRKTISVQTICDQIELSIGQELPDEIYTSNDMQSLRWAATDWAGLLNDLVSHDKEVRDGEGAYNAVSAMASLVGEEQARDRLIRLINQRGDRMAELIPRFAHSEATAGFVRSLAACMAGWLAWQHETTRYDVTHMTPSATL
ncbi:terpene synthase family protein [Streptomyces sp. NPDC054796]